MTTSSTITAPAPLTPDQLAAIQLAHTRSKKLRRATTVATVDAAIMAVFTAFCILSALFDPIAGITLGTAFGYITYTSFRGAAGLRRFDPTAPRLLAFNQAVLAVCVIAYAAWSLYSALNVPPDLARHYKEISDLDPQLGKMLQDTSRLLYQVLYTSLIGGTLIAQGLTGWYYASRAKLLNAYLAETPAWVLDLQRQQVQ